MRISKLTSSLGVLLTAGIGFLAGSALDRGAAQDRQAKNGSVDTEKSQATRKPGAQYLRQSPGAEKTMTEENDYGLGDCYVTKLKPYPAAKCGDATPLDLYRYAGRGASSWSPPTLDVSWDEWVNHCRTLKPKVMAECRAYMKKHYDFNNKPIPGAKMSGDKPIMMGPVARLPESVHSYEELAELSPEEIKKRDIFPYVPLAHPLQSTAHMLFPDAWIRSHPDHERFDCDF